MERGYIQIIKENAEKIHPNLSKIDFTIFDCWFNLDNKYFLLENKKTSKSLITKSLKNIETFLNEKV